MSLEEAILNILSVPELSDQSLFFRRWDSTVQGKTLRESISPMNNMPFDQGITVPQPGGKTTQVLSMTINPWWAGNPVNMTKACVIGSVSKQIAAGVKRKKISLCDNFYTPKSNPKTDFFLTEMVRVMTDLMVDLETPIISGKDSSSGSTKIQKKDGTEEVLEIVPTICMTALGVGEDSGKIPPKALQKAGNSLFLISAGISNDLSGSVLLSATDRKKSFNYEVDIEIYKKTIDRLAELIEEGKISAISVVDDGGVIHRLFEMMLGSGLGVELNGNICTLEFLSRAIPGSFIIEVQEAQDLNEIDAQYIGKVSEHGLKIKDTILNFENMKKTWERTWYEILNIAQEAKNITAPEHRPRFRPSKLSRKKINVVYTPGINCHREMVRAWEILGADVRLISVTEPDAKFADADIVVFPGGFADGDYLGAAKVWHRVMETTFKDQMEYLRTGKIPVLGICNGFQLMTRSGFFGKNLRLTWNESGKFEQRWVKTKFTEHAEKSPWTKGLSGKEMSFPVAHGEGRFVMDGVMTEAKIGLVYEPNMYPNNPNGSAAAIAGVIAGEKGQFFGCMPHPERAIEAFHFTQDGLFFFENILKNL